MFRVEQLSAVPSEVVECIILAASVCTGWLVWSTVIGFFARIDVTCKKTLDAKLADTEESEVEAANFNFQAEDPIRTSAEDIFEHYGIFDAIPGTWGEFAPSSELNWDVSMEEVAQRKIVSSGSLLLDVDQHSHFDILEHYGLFGAEAGVWSSGLNSSSQSQLAHCNSAIDVVGHQDLFDLLPDAWGQEVSSTSDCSDLVRTAMPEFFELGMEDSIAVAHLLEHYHLFAASPGAWAATDGEDSASEGNKSRPVAFAGNFDPKKTIGGLSDVSDVSDVSTNDVSDGDWQLDETADGAASEYHKMVGSVAVGHFFEEYGLFDAAPGSWSLASG